MKTLLSFLRDDVGAILPVKACRGDLVPFVLEPCANNVLNFLRRNERRHESPQRYASFVMMIVPEAANMPPTPWHTESLAPGTWAGAVPRIWRTLSCSAYMPYMPECM